MSDFDALAKPSLEQIGVDLDITSNREERMIRVWRFDAAPRFLQSLSEHGGDEDWLAILPPGMEPPRWMESGTAFGCCDVSEAVTPNGWTILIGAHA